MAWDQDHIEMPAISLLISVKGGLHNSGKGRVCQVGGGGEVDQIMSIGKYLCVCAPLNEMSRHSN